MSFLDKFLKKQQKERLEKQAERAAGDLKSEKKPSRVAKKPAVKEKSAAGTHKVSIGKIEDKKTVKKTAKTKIKFIGRDILIKPLITEKISSMAENGKYAFMILPEANKPAVKKAVSSLYGVKVMNVRIINVLGKNVRYGRSFGKRSDWKKAIVTLAPGEKIEIYEGV